LAGASAWQCSADCVRRELETHLKGERYAIFGGRGNSVGKMIVPDGVFRANDKISFCTLFHEVGDT
jgi:hypothetical protein